MYPELTSSVASHAWENLDPKLPWGTTISGRLPMEGWGEASRATGIGRKIGRAANGSAFAPGAASNHTSLTILRERAWSSISMVTAPTTRVASAASDAWEHATRIT